MSYDTLKALAKKLTDAGYSGCAFSDFEYYPIMAEEFSEVAQLTDEEEATVIEIMESTEADECI